jgi:hypothetical protein
LLQLNLVVYTTSKNNNTNVRDAKTGNVIVKMMKLLPVAATISIDLKSISIANKVAVKTVLSGKPTDTNSRAVESFSNVAEAFTAALPDY